MDNQELEKLIEATLPKLRDRSGWWKGDADARGVLKELIQTVRVADAEEAAYHRVWGPPC
jgi:hypothetical protein